MSANFSPTAQAARLMSTRSGASAPSGHSAAPMHPSRPVAAGEQWCEWPRRSASKPAFTSIRQALMAIQQARHA